MTKLNIGDLKLGSLSEELAEIENKMKDL